jgi:hypothetical protein
MSKSSFTGKTSIKSAVFTSIFAVFLLGIAAPPSASAQTEGQYAKGAYQFSFEDGYMKYVEFEALAQADGSTTGQMTLSDEAPISYQDVDGTGDRTLTETYKGFYIKAEFDSLVVNKNQAVMSGSIRDSSISQYIGQRVLLTVEDNGDNTKEFDRVTWGVYRPVARDWRPSDAELKEDAGAGLRWWATDAERKDDVGYAMPRDETINTQTFPISAYPFIDVSRAAGDIVVR